MNEQGEYVLYEFGPFRVDPLKRQLLRDGEPQPLASKAFDTLAILLANRGETVSKAELMNSVWGETAVEENNLTQQISTLRKFLGERARDHKYIVTVPGRGYCFVAAVTETRMTSVETFSPEVVPSAAAAKFIGSRRKDRFPVIAFESGSLRGASLAVAYVLFVCLVVFVFQGRNAGSSNRTQSVAVIGFRTLGDTDEELGAGIRDTLRAKLGSIDDLTVRPGRSDLVEQDTVALGRQIHADVVLTGSVQREQSRVRVAVEMVDVSGERIVWGKTFDESVSNVFELQDSIASEVVRALRNAKSPGARLSEFGGARKLLPRSA